MADGRVLEKSAAEHTERKDERRGFGGKREEGGKTNSPIHWTKFLPTRSARLGTYAWLPAAPPSLGAPRSFDQSSPPRVIIKLLIRTKNMSGLSDKHFDQKAWAARGKSQRFKHARVGDLREVLTHDP